MTRRYSIWLHGASALLLALMLGGCPSGKRVVVEGYSDNALVNKRIMVVAPEAADVKISNPAAFAFARGVVADASQEKLANELRTQLTPAIAARLDSNTVLYYKDQAVSGLVPMNATTDFTGAQPKSWETIRRAGREGNVDFLIVLNGMTIANSAASNGGRGTESVETTFSLLDTKAGTVVTSGRVSIPSDEANPATTYARLAEKLTSQMPFYVGTGVKQ
jgi:hypothetical protein